MKSTTNKNKNIAFVGVLAAFVLMLGAVAPNLGRLNAYASEDNTSATDDNNNNNTNLFPIPSGESHIKIVIDKQRNIVNRISDVVNETATNIEQNDNNNTAEIVSEIDTTTNDLGQQITDLRGQVTDGNGVTNDKLDNLQASVDRLNHKVHSEQVTKDKALREIKDLKAQIADMQKDLTKQIKETGAQTTANVNAHTDSDFQKFWKALMNLFFGKSHTYSSDDYNKEHNTESSN